MATTLPPGRRVTIAQALRYSQGVLRAENAGVTDHGALTGLGDDDHPQYLTQAEGDALYAPFGSAGGQVPGYGTLFDPTTTFFIKDDFLASGFASESTGELGWGFTTGSAQAPTAPISGHPGILQRNVTGAGQRIYTWLYNNVVSIVPADNFDNLWIVKPLTATGSTAIRFGFFASNADPPASGIYLEKKLADTEWFGVCRSAGSETRTSSGLGAVSTASFARLRLRRKDGSTISFSLNGGTEQDVTTNVPTADLTISSMYGQDDTTAQLLYDYFSLLITGLSR